MGKIIISKCTLSHSGTAIRINDPNASVEISDTRLINNGRNIVVERVDSLTARAVVIENQPNRHARRSAGAKARKGWSRNYKLPGRD